MHVLLDTNILVRLANTTDRSRPVAERAIAELAGRGETISITPQNVIEFRAVATRPVAVNGLGLSASQAEVEIRRFEAQFAFLPDHEDIYPTWTALVSALAVVGKTVHDARLVAVCHVHSATHLLTFNLSQFQTLALAPPGLVVLDPATV